LAKSTTSTLELGRSGGETDADHRRMEFASADPL